MQSTECIVLNIKVVVCLRYDGIKVSTSSTIKEIYSVILLKTIEKRHSHGNGRDSTREMSRIWWQTIGLFTISCTLDVSSNTSKCKHTYSIQSWAPSNAKQLSASVATRMWLFTSSPKINEIFIELDLSLSMAISMLISIHSKWLYSYHTHTNPSHRVVEWLKQNTERAIERWKERENGVRGPAIIVFYVVNISKLT